MASHASNRLDAALDPLPDAPFCVALSGGVDSTALLHVLARRCRAMSRPLRALHVHHGLSVHADAWVQACEAACALLAVPLLVRRVDVAVAAGLGTEGAARHARRAVFAEELAPGEVLVLAHHGDDQAETFLLRALRGSGPDGLAAMRNWQPFARGHLWRPWLGVSRSEIEAHATANCLRWIEDDSNAEDRFDRNFLRMHVMPVLRARWPHTADALGRAAAHCSDASVLLDEDDLRALASARMSDAHVLSIAELRRLSVQRRARVLRAWVASLGLPPLPLVGVDRIETDLLNARPDASASFHWHGAGVRAWGGILHADRARDALALTLEATWNGAEALALPGNAQLRLEGAARFDAPLHIRARHGGERITLSGRTHSHALKHVLQRLGVPPWLRSHLPLLFDGNGVLLAAGDLAYSAEFEAWLRGRGARISWQPPCD